ncbi:hypothetical protein LEMLEM_LOCUS2003 [Lemmus lemmus]
METEAETHTQTLDGGQGILTKRGRRIGGLNGVKDKGRELFSHRKNSLPSPCLHFPLL